MKRRAAATAAVLCAVALFCGLTITLGGVFGLFSSTTASPSNNFATAPDYAAPSASRSVIGKTQGGTPGFIHQGGTYYVFADVSDSGNPASGIATVTSNTSTVTTGASSTSLAAGPFSVGGLSYSHRALSQTANATLAEGTYSYTLGLSDNAGNSRSQSGFSVVVDNTAPSASDVQSANTSGGTAGRAEAGDTITYTFSEPPDPSSILSGWNGTSTTVTVRIFNGLIVLGNDFLRVYDSSNTTQLPLGQVDLGRSDYVAGLLGLGEATNFTSSTMAISGNALTVTLGTSGGNVSTAGGNGTMQWSSSSTPTDRAGNAATGNTVNENNGSGADKEF
jgi:hypothetical protein